MTTNNLEDLDRHEMAEAIEKFLDCCERPTGKLTFSVKPGPFTDQAILNLTTPLARTCEGVMKLVVERDPFVSAVGAANRVIRNGPPIPILSNVLLSPDQGQLRVRGTDLEFVSETALPAEIQANGSNERGITAPAQTLASVCEGLPKGATITLEWQPAGPLTVRSGRSRYSLHTLPATDYPEFPLPAQACSFSVPGPQLAENLEAVSFAIGEDKSRTYLHGVNWAVVGDDLVLCAADGGELARAAMKRPAGLDKMPSIIVPERAVNEISRIAKSADSVTVSIDKNKIAVVVGQTMLISKLIEGTFPEYQPIMKVARPNSFIVDVADFIGAVTRLRALDNDARMQAALEDGALTLSLVNPRHGDAAEHLEVEYEGPKIKLGLKSGGMLHILNGMKTEACIFSFADRSTPFLVRPYFKEPMTDRQFLTAPVSTPA